MGQFWAKTAQTRQSVPSQAIDFIGAPERIRTSDPQIRSKQIYYFRSDNTISIKVMILRINT